jgi:hypothetical protein
LTEVKKALEEIGASVDELSTLLGGVDENVATHTAILACRRRIDSHFQTRGLVLTPGALEQLLLSTAAQSSEPRIDSLPVHAAVKTLIRSEFASWLKPGPRAADLVAGTGNFGSAAKIATLRRFPAGPMDWDLAGIPRSWLVKVPRRDLPGLLSCILRLGGFRPLLHVHVGLRPRNRSLVIEREVRRSYYRMVRSMELQPEIRGILGVAWFFDPNAVAENPHLAYLNAPFREGGGFITDIGPAPPDSGFTEHNARRGELYKSGQLLYQSGLAIWPRDKAIEWARCQSELES